MSERPHPVTWFNRRLGELLAYGYVVVFALTFYEVMARYLFSAPTQWTLEITLIVAGLHYILCGPQVMADDGHIAVTAVTDKLSPSTQHWLKQFGLLVALGCCVILIWAAWNQAAFSIEFNERSGTIFNSRMPIILKVALIVSMALLALQTIVNLAAGRRR